MMSTDMGPESPFAPRRSDTPAPPDRRWRRALLAIGALAVLASAALLIPRTGASQDSGPVRTHTITRSNLTVTVTEQGTLESADNTEIKCRVRGHSTIIWVIESGSVVEPGDELVRLDTLAVEDEIAERTKDAHQTRSGAERAKADFARAELAIPEYLEGRFRSELMTLEKDLAIFMSNERTAQNMLAHARMMAERGYVSGLELHEKQFAVTQAELNLEVKRTEIEVLKGFTKAMELESLQGDLNAARSRYDAEAERARTDAARRDLALEELENCVIRAERGGLVIYPRARAWKRAPDIEEGATVHRDQTLLLMPDLAKMQVKVGMHESVIDCIQPGMPALITLPGRTLEGQVASVAPVTRPGGWWTGNVVKYDTIIKLPQVDGLKPGMSAEVEVVIDRHENVLTIPVTAVVETPQGAFGWVPTSDGAIRRPLQLGDANDNFAVVKAGLQQGDKVILDPRASVADAQTLALEALGDTEPQSPESEDRSTRPVNTEIDRDA